MKFIDRVELAGTRRRGDGALLADANVARTGVQVYSGHECGKPQMDVVRVYRPGDEVFSDETLKSFAHRPVTDDHPNELVTSDNWKDHAVGQTADEIRGKGRYIRVPLMVSDGPTIKKIEDGKRELSAGYTCTLDWTPGETPGGEQFDAVQRNIRANHIAVVSAARGGSELRIGDDADTWGAAPITPTHKETDAMSDKLRNVVVDGLTVETTDQGAQAITKLQNQLKDSAASLEKLQQSHDAAIKAKDEEIGTLKADLKKAQDAQPTAEQMSKMVADRVALETVVAAIDKSIKTEGVSDADIRKAAVAKKLGDEMVKDASEAEIAGMFKAVAKDIDPVRDVLSNGVHNSDSRANDNGQDAYQQRLADAWKHPAEQKGA